MKENKISDRQQYNKVAVEFQERRFTEWEGHLKTARKFFNDRKQQLLDAEYSWSFSYHCDELHINAITSWWTWNAGGKDWDYKKIAKSFGSRGWQRVKDSNQCGSLNWEKTVDGIKVILVGVEKIEPKLIEEVKLA